MSDIKETIDEQLGGTVSKAEQFYNKNKRTVQIAGGVVALAIIGFFGFRYMQQSKQTEANAKIFFIEEHFKNDSFDLVLNGNPKNADEMGAIEFVDEYGGTPAGQRAAFMAGRAYMAKGDFESAIDYLKKCKLADDIFRPQVIGLLGDCYAETKDFEEAESYYQKAANYSANPYTTPKFLKKLGLVQEKLGKNKEAAENYSKIKKEYAESEFGRDIDKYIARASAKAGIGAFDY